VDLDDRSLVLTGLDQSGRGGDQAGDSSNGCNETGDGAGERYGKNGYTSRQNPASCSALASLAGSELVCPGRISSEYVLQSSSAKALIW
jgi:hypothetical protein